MGQRFQQSSAQIRAGVTPGDKRPGDAWLDAIGTWSLTGLAVLGAFVIARWLVDGTLARIVVGVGLIALTLLLWRIRVAAERRRAGSG